MKKDNAVRISDINYYEKADNIFQKAFVSVQSNCALCCNNLEITVSSADEGQLKEEAYCPACELKLRSRLHVVQ